MKTLSLGRVSGIIQVDSVSSRESLQAENFSQSWSERAVMTEKVSERFDVANCEDEGKGRQPRDVGSLWERKGGKRMVPWSLQKGT